MTAAVNKQYIENVKNAPPFGRKDKLGYMMGDLGFNSLQVIVNSYLMLFCVNVMGVKATHFASIVFICKALDALNDTFIGRTVDKRPATKYGKMKPYLKWFAIPYMIFTVVLFFNVSTMPYALRIAWILVIYFIWGIIGTFINVPYGAMSNIITTDQVQRTELSNFRSIGSFVGSLLPTTIAPLLLFDENQNPIANRFIVLSIVVGLFCVICLYLSHKLISERVLVADNTNTAASDEKVNYLKVAKSFLKNRVMIAVVMAYIVSKLFVQPVAMINQYVFMVYFQDTSMLSVASLSSMIPVVLGMMCVKPLVKRFGKKNLVTWPSLAAAACYVITAFAPMTPVTWIVVQLGASCCTAATSLLLWSMIADAVDYQAYLTGERNDGTVYATITFLVFFAASASTSIIALMLEVLGYDATLGSTGQLPGVSEKLKVFGGMWPAVGCLLVFICYKIIYNLSDADMSKISAAVLKKSQDTEAAILSEMKQN